tara:strand:+ start:540 stop:815 length:276 start_codon:yes stop_codon:yes gene_type:complete
MKDNSSKYQMENSLELLNSIQRVNPPEGLLAQIEGKIEKVKGNMVPLTWVKLTAAVFICVFSVEIYVLSYESEHDDLTELIQTADNTLYDE